jgi:hypothetical protein
MPYSSQVQEGGQVYEKESYAKARYASGHQQGVQKVNMDLKLDRFCYHPEGTLGVMEIDGEKFYSIERPWLENAPNVSCIPTGTYEMTWRESPRFGWTWMLENVPDRTYILIHVANFSKDVQGCIGLGTGLMGDRIAVSNSRKAVAAFEELTRGQTCQIEISNAAYAAL